MTSQLCPDGVVVSPITGEQRPAWRLAGHSFAEAMGVCYNILVKDDLIYEFLLPFFLRPELRGRGIEACYCLRLGFDPGALSWYHGLEYLDSWRWVLLTGQAYEQHTDKSLRADLARWLAEA